MPVQNQLPARTVADPYSLLRREVDSLFSDFFRTNGWPASTLAPSTTGWMPAIDVADDGECFRITADLPGMERKDVTVVVEDDRLLLSGSRSDEKEEKGRNWHRRERTSGEFRREIPLGVEIDTKKAAATMHNGVLSIELPKKPEAVQKRKVLEIKQS